MKKLYMLLLLSLLLCGCTAPSGPDPDQAAKAEEEADSSETAKAEEALPDTNEEDMESPMEDTEFPSVPGTPPLEEPEAEPEPDELLALTEEILAAAESDYERVKAIHDYLVVHVDYDYENLATDTLPDTAFTKEGALLLHSAVCEGYAKAFSYLCQQAGIEELLVYGTANDGTGVQSHAWNQVCIDGEWYNVDVTWDDPLMNGQVITDGSNIIYEYFLVPDMTLLGNHTAETPEKLHACTSDRYLEENRRLTIEPYLIEPYSFASSDDEAREAVEHYLSEGIHRFQLICDVIFNTPENRSEFVLNQVKDTMTARGEYGQISVETQYGIADYAIIGVTITQ